MTHHATQPHPVETARGSDAWHGDPDETPVADSPSDITSRVIEIDGGTAIVEHLDDRVEVTVRIGDRLTAALILSPAEADMLGMAIARPAGPTTGDLFRVADAMNADASTLARAWGTAQHA